MIRGSPRVGYTSIRLAPCIDLSATFARPNQPIALDRQPNIGCPMLIQIRAIRDNTPVLFSLLLIFEDTMSLSSARPMCAYHGWQYAVSKSPIRAGAIVRRPNADDRIATGPGMIGRSGLLRLNFSIIIPKASRRYPTCSRRLVNRCPSHEHLRELYHRSDRVVDILFNLKATRKFALVALWNRMI